MLDLIKDFLSYSKGERNGTIILLFVVFVFILVPGFLPLFIKQKEYDFEKFLSEIDAFERQFEEENLNGKKPDETGDYKLFKFNPNDLPDEKWRELGVNDRTISIIKNYEAKGGTFYRKSDLKKIYGFTEKDYERLEPFIAIPQKPKTKIEHQAIEPKTYANKADRHYKKRTVATHSFIVELNNSDSIMLMHLNGIGPVLSSRIIKYRDLLGGFYDKDQLLEVYGIDSLLYAQLDTFLAVDTLFVQKININTVEKEELVKHPYFDYNIANALLNYRRMHGRFKKVEELRKLYAVNDRLFVKISPYIKVE